MRARYLAGLGVGLSSLGRGGIDWFIVFSMDRFVSYAKRDNETSDKVEIQVRTGNFTS